MSGAKRVTRADDSAESRRRKGLGMDKWDMQGAALDGAMIGLVIGEVFMIVVIAYTLWW